MLYLLVILFGLSTIVWLLSNPSRSTGLPLRQDMWESGIRVSIALGATTLVVVMMVAPRVLGYLILSVTGIGTIMFYIAVGFLIGAFIPIVRRIRTHEKTDSASEQTA